MISKSYLSREFQELSQIGTFRWERGQTGLPTVKFTPSDPADKQAAFEGELFVENCLGGELERFESHSDSANKFHRYFSVDRPEHEL